MCNILSNIAAGTPEQVKAFIGRKELLDKLAGMFHTDEPEVAREICWIYPNLKLDNRAHLVQLCLDYDLIACYANLLTVDNPDILDNVLETLTRLMGIGRKCKLDGISTLLRKFMEAGGIAKLERLQTMTAKKVESRVAELLEKFPQLQGGHME
jgi:hypothetical protein